MDPMAEFDSANELTMVEFMSAFRYALLVRIMQSWLMIFMSLYQLISGDWICLKRPLRL